MNEQDQIFMRHFAMVIGVLVLMAIVFAVAAAIVGGDVNQVPNPAHEEALAQRIKPVGQVKVGSQAASGAEQQAASSGGGEEPSGQPTQVAQAGASGGADGEQTFKTVCFACHGTGAGGAPMVSKPEAWHERLEKGKDTLYQHAINGFQGDAGIMPPKGGRMDLSDETVKAAVDYMVSQVKQ